VVLGDDREPLGLDVERSGEVGRRRRVEHVLVQEQAREHLTTAATMSREMDMRFSLEKAEAEMRALA